MNHTDCPCKPCKRVKNVLPAACLLEQYAEIHNLQQDKGFFNFFFKRKGR
jgi:hypothetical protein